MKVLMVIINMIPEDGVCSFAMNYLRKVYTHHDINIDFVVYKNVNINLKKEIESYGCKVYQLPPLKDYKRHKKECEKIFKNKYDIVHDNSLIRTVPLLKAAKKAGCRIRILHSHNSKLSDSKVKEKVNKLFLPLLLKEVTDYVACSDIAGQNLFGKHDFEFLPNTINGEKFKYNENYRNDLRSQLQKDTFILGTVGRIAEQKNPLFGLKVVEALSKRIDNFEFWWIGDGNLRSEMENYIRDHHLEKYVRLLGSKQEVWKYYDAIDVFLLPSLFEGLPVSMVEAQASGLPCFVSDTITKQASYSDLVHYLPISNAEEWADQIERLNINKIKSNRATYYNVFENSIFSDQHAYNNMKNLYTKLLRKK